MLLLVVLVLLRPLPQQPCSQQVVPSTHSMGRGAAVDSWCRSSCLLPPLLPLGNGNYIQRKAGPVHGGWKRHMAVWLYGCSVRPPVFRCFVGVGTSLVGCGRSGCESVTCQQGRWGCGVPHHLACRLVCSRYYAGCIA
jgi:hypothetical protein